MMTIEVNGTRYGGFMSAAVRRSMNALCGEFSFAATSDNVKTFADFPVQRLDSIKIYIDNNKILDGFVDKIDISYNATDHSINIYGRDKTLILVDSSIPTKRTFSAPIDLKKIAENIISQLGASSVLSVENNIVGLKTFSQEEMRNLVADHDETAFDYLDRLAKIANVLLISNTDGDLVIDRTSETDTINTVLLNRLDNEKDNNNILGATISYNDTERFREYKVFSQQVDLETTSNNNQATQVGETQEDDEALQYKKKTIMLEHSGSINDCTNRAKWEAGIRRGKAVSYICEVDGHYYNSSKTGLWDINKFVQVFDDYASLNALMLVNSVEYKENLDSGSTTVMELIYNDAYELLPSAPLGTGKFDSFGAIA